MYVEHHRKQGLTVKLLRTYRLLEPSNFITAVRPLSCFRQRKVLPFLLQKETPSPTCSNDDRRNIPTPNGFEPQGVDYELGWYICRKRTRLRVDTRTLVPLTCVRSSRTLVVSLRIQRLKFQRTYDGRRHSNTVRPNNRRFIPFSQSGNFLYPETIHLN